MTKLKAFLWSAVQDGQNLGLSAVKFKKSAGYDDEIGSFLRVSSSGRNMIGLSAVRLHWSAGFDGSKPKICTGQLIRTKKITVAERLDIGIQVSSSCRMGQQV